MCGDNKVLAHNLQDTEVVSLTGSQVSGNCGLVGGWAYWFPCRRSKILVHWDWPWGKPERFSTHLHMNIQAILKSRENPKVVIRVTGESKLQQAFGLHARQQQDHPNMALERWAWVWRHNLGRGVQCMVTVIMGEWKLHVCLCSCNRWVETLPSKW